MNVTVQEPRINLEIKIIPERKPRFDSKHKFYKGKYNIQFYCELQ